MATHLPFKRSFGVKHASLCILCCLASLKLGTMAWIGVLLTPDSGGYIDVASAIHTQGLFVPGQPLSSFRAIGYPLFLSLCKGIFAGQWLWGAVMIQNMLSLFTAWVLYGVARRLTNLPYLAWAMALCYLSITGLFLYDNAILTDSLSTNLLVLICALLFFSYAQGLLIPCSLGAGALLALAFLVREVTLPLSFSLLVPALLLSWGAGENWKSVILRLFLVFVPIIAEFGGIGAYNKSQTGNFYITTGGKTTLMQPVMRAASRNRAIYNRNDLFDRAALKHLTDGGFANVLAINQELAREGVPDKKVSDMAYARYFEAWWAFPLDMGQQVLKELNIARIVSRTFSIWDHLRLLVKTTAEKSLQQLLPEGVSLPLKYASRFVSSVLMLAFFLGIPGMLLGNMAGWPCRVRFWGAVFIGWWGYALTYAFVHLEPRYLMGIAVFPLFFTLYSVNSYIVQKRDP